MNEPIRFRIPYAVKQKQGDRSRVIVGKYVQHYQTTEIETNAAALVILAVKHAPAVPFRGPIAVALCFEFPWLQSHSKKKRATRERWKTTKPDIDNLQKQILDCLKAAGFFVDDAQVSLAIPWKAWSDRPGVRVTILELEQEGPVNVTGEIGRLLGDGRSPGPDPGGVRDGEAER